MHSGMACRIVVEYSLDTETESLKLSTTQVTLFHGEGLGRF